MPIPLLLGVHKARHGEGMPALTKPTPKGPRTQIIRVSGPKYHDINGSWALKPYYLGPWTLRVLQALRNPQPKNFKPFPPNPSQGKV